MFAIVSHWLYLNHYAARLGSSIMMNQFIHNIPSIYQRHPGLPTALGNIDLNCGIQAGDPLNYAEIRNACATVTALKALQDEFRLQTILFVVFTLNFI